MQKRPAHPTMISRPNNTLVHIQECSIQVNHNYNKFHSSGLLFIPVVSSNSKLTVSILMMLSARKTMNSAMFTGWQWKATSGSPCLRFWSTSWCTQRSTRSPLGLKQSKMPSILLLEVVKTCQCKSYLHTSSDNVDPLYFMFIS